MAKVAVVGSMSTGHDACAPVPAVTGCSWASIDGRPIVCVGDKFQTHGCLVHGPHQGIVSSGSSFMFLDGKPVARVGDLIADGGCTSAHKIATGVEFLDIDS